MMYTKIIDVRTSQWSVSINDFERGEDLFEWDMRWLSCFCTYKEDPRYDDRGVGTVMLVNYGCK